MQNSLYVHRNIFLPVSKTGFYTDMQEFYDRCLPGNSFVLNDFDAVTMRLRDNEFNLQPCRLTLSNLDPVPALIKSGYNDVNTVHEIQGETFEETAVVRATPTPIGLIARDSPHVSGLN